MKHESVSRSLTMSLVIPDFPPGMGSSMDLNFDTGEMLYMYLI